MMNIRRWTEIKVAGEWYKKLGSIALWYAGVSRLVWFILICLSLWAGESFNLLGPYLMSPDATNIFMLVIGIVLPLVWYEPFIALGVTRKQLCRGILLAALLISLSIAAFHTLINFIIMLSGVSKELFLNRIHSLFSDTICFMIYFMMGWIIAAGFGYRRFLTAALGIIAFHFFSDMTHFIKGVYSFLGSLINFLMRGKGTLGGEVFALRLPAPALNVSLVLLAVIMVVIIGKVTEKLPVKS
jgi:hypothetical protein